jgi:prepilin peptidase CpaA
MTLAQQIALVVFPFTLAFAAASDLLTMTISNRISLVLLAGFALLAPLSGMDVSTITLHAAAGGAVLAVGFTCFSFGWIGGGDAKLAAMIALWLGWGATIEFLTIAAVLGGILTFAILGLRSAILPALMARQAWLLRLHDPRSGVPYGIALSAAGLMAFPHTAWMSLAA